MRAKYSSLPLQFVETNSNKKTKTVPGLRSVSSPHETTPNTSILMAKDVEDFDGSINESTFSLLISSGLSVVFIVSGGYSREDGFALQRRIIPAMYRDRVSVELVHWPALTEKKILNHLQHIRGLFVIQFSDCLLLNSLFLRRFKASFLSHISRRAIAVYSRASQWRYAAGH